MDIGQGYKVIIQENMLKPGKPPISVVSYMPEEVALGFSADYDQPFQTAVNVGLTGLSALRGFDLAKKATGNNPFAALAGAVAGAATPHFAASAMGSSLTAPILTAKMWQSSSMNAVSLPLYFQAETDPIEEIRKPILELMSLVVPTTNSVGLLQSPAPHINSSKAVETIKKSAKEVFDKAASNNSSFLEQGLDMVKGAVSGILPQDASNLIDSVSKRANAASSQLDKIAKIPSATEAALHSALGVKAKADYTSEAKTASSYLQKTLNSMTSSATMIPYLNKTISVQIGTYLTFPCVVIHDVSPTFSSQIDPVTGWPMAAQVNVTFSPMFAMTQKDMLMVMGGIQQLAYKQAQGYVQNSLTGAIGAFVNEKATGALFGADGESGLIGGAGSFVKGKVKNVVDKKADSWINSLGGK